MTFGAQNTEADAHSQLDLALHNDINFIDTAELYPAPASADTYAIAEQMIGRWLKRQDRSKVVLATKVVGPAPKKWIGYIRNGPQLSPAQIETALNDSLKRLHTDYIDLYQIHWPARNTNYFGKLGYEYDKDKHDYPIEETLQTLAGLKDAGKIRQLGVSNETPWGLHQYLSGKYLNDLQPEGARLTLHRNYFYRYTTPRATDAIRQYVQIAQDHGLAPSTMAMAFVYRQPFVTSTIVGATTLAQLQENIDSVNCELDDDVIKAIQTVHQQQPNPCP